MLIIEVKITVKKETEHLMEVNLLTSNNKIHILSRMIVK